MHFQRLCQTSYVLNRKHLLEKVCSPQPFCEFVFAINKLKKIFPLKRYTLVRSYIFLSTVEVPSSYAKFKSYLVLDTLWLWFIAITNSCWSVNGRVTFNVEFLSIKRLCGNIYYNREEHVSLYMIRKITSECFNAFKKHFISIFLTFLFRFIIIAHKWSVQIFLRTWTSSLYYNICDISTV